MTSWRMEPTSLASWIFPTTQAIGSILEHPIFYQTHGRKPSCNHESLNIFKNPILSLATIVLHGLAQIIHNCLLGPKDRVERKSFLSTHTCQRPMHVSRFQNMARRPPASLRRCEHLPCGHGLGRPELSIAT